MNLEDFARRLVSNEGVQLTYATGVTRDGKQVRIDVVARTGRPELVARGLNSPKYKFTVYVANIPVSTGELDFTEFDMRVFAAANGWQLEIAI